VSPNSPKPPSCPRSGKRALAVLWVVYVFNFVDRNILSILLDPSSRSRA